MTNWPYHSNLFSLKVLVLNFVYIDECLCKLIHIDYVFQPASIHCLLHRSIQKCDLFVSCFPPQIYNREYPKPYSTLLPVCTAAIAVTPIFKYCDGFFASIPVLIPILFNNRSKFQLFDLNFSKIVGAIYYDVYKESELSQAQNEYFCF
jgi:hypothetical protein